MALARAPWPLLALVAAFAVACGGGSESAPDPTPSSSASTPAPAAAATATASPTAAPAWWESPTPSPTPEFPMSRVWNARVEAASDAEVVLTFDYHLDLAPEANVFVHMGLLPNVNLILLDGDGGTIEGIGGELDPTEFGDDTVGGEATFTFATSRFDDVAAVDVCIRVVTGNYDDFVGRTEIFCEPVAVVKAVAE